MAKYKRRNLVKPPGVVFDVEGDGLNPTKLHCLSMTQGEGEFTSTDYAEMRNFFEDQKIIIGHNIRRWDIPHLNRLLGINIDCIVVDTLALSWYLEPERSRHGLADWGEDVGVAKPPVEDWSDQPIEVYIHRCEQDVSINWKVWIKFWNKLLEIYDGNESKIWDFLQYLDFKMICAQKQEESKWKIDLELAQKTRNTLETLKTSKVEELKAAMPKVPITSVRSYPAKPLKKDGTLSAAGVKWYKLLEEQALPRYHRADVEVVTGYEDPNPGSHHQIKKWLYDLGWQPVTFKHKRNKETGELKSTEQVNKEHGGGICESVKVLFDKEPRLEVLDGLSVISHRMSILDGLISSVDDQGFVQASIQGLTNTLRFKHKTVVNLPKVGKPYGEEIRGCLVARKGKLLCGSDMASLEDRLKQHFMYKYDPEYVESVNKEGYDPHLALAVMGKMTTQEAADAYINGTDKSIKPIRDIAKNGNYSCQYGAGPPRIAITAGISLDQAKIVHKAYWDLNWAIKAVAEDQTYKHVGDQMWLLNPISGFWYSLRTPKDIFSTLVQGTASYVFDMWISFILQRRDQITAQFHDEGVWECCPTEKEEMESIINESIKETNDFLRLDRELGITIQWGERYSDIH